MNYRSTSSTIAGVFLVMGFILGFTILRSLGVEGFHIADFDETMSRVIIGLFVVLAVLFAAGAYFEMKMVSIPAIIVGIIGIVLGVCIMGGFIDSVAGYTGWSLIIFGIGHIYGGYLVMKTF